MSDYSKQIDEILDNHKRWVIESTLPANSFNEATIAGIDERAKAKLQHLLQQVERDTMRKVMDVGQNPVTTVSEATFGRRVYKYLSQSLQKTQGGEK